MFKVLNSGFSNLIRNATRCSTDLLKSAPSITKSIANNFAQLSSGGLSLVPHNLKGSLFAMPAKVEFTQVRHWGYKGRMMLKDIKRRELLRKFAPERVRLQTLRANHILPKILRVL